jgi:hypothetical protein
LFIRQPHDGTEAHHIEDDRVHEVKGAVEEVDLVPHDHIRDRGQDVFVDGEDHRSDEQSDEAPEDEEVRQAGLAVPLGHRGVRGDGRDRRLQRTRPGQLLAVAAGLFPHFPPPADGPPAPVLLDTLPGVGGEGERSRGRQHVEQDFGRTMDTREDLACLFDRQR